ncbi:helicase-associated protein, partial [Streptomyces scabiei]|nr:helicase-associated protein [Streptomyces scabiei]
PTTTQVLEALDPWWNPPWPSIWQRTYQEAKLHQLNSRPHPPALQKWTERQRTRWNTLHPQQQHLLTTIGIHPG